MVASDVATGEVHAVGADAERMIGRTPATISATRPLRHGVIADFEVTEEMLRYFIRKVIDRRMAHPRLIVCAPSGVTEVEKRAVEEASLAAGARRVHLIEEPIAAAIGAGLAIEEPVGRMVVDVGGGTSEMAVISLGGIVDLALGAGRRLRDGRGDHAYLRNVYQLAIGSRTAETIKIEIGSAIPLQPEETIEVRGRHLVTGLPTAVQLRSEEVRAAISGAAARDPAGDPRHARADAARAGQRHRPRRDPARRRRHPDPRLPRAGRRGDRDAGVPRRVAADLRRRRLGPGARRTSTSSAGRAATAAPSAHARTGARASVRQAASQPAAWRVAHAASRIRNGSSGSRKRGVSTLMNTTLSAISNGTPQSHRGAARAARVNAPASASRHRTRSDHARPGRRRAGCPTAAAEACQAQDPSSSNSRSVLSAATSSGSSGWAPM